MSGVLRRDAAADKVQLGHGKFDAGAGVLPYAFGVVEDVGHGAGGDACASGDVHQLGTGVSAGAGGALAVEDVALAVAGARRRFRTGNVVSDQGRQPVRRVDGAVAVILGRAADQLARVQFVQLVFHAYGAGPGKLGLQADDFTPSHPRVALEDHGDELVVAAGQQDCAFGDEKQAERVGDDLLGATVAGTAGAFAASAPLRCGVGRDEALVHGIFQY